VAAVIDPDHHYLDTVFDDNRVELELLKVSTQRQ